MKEYMKSIDSFKDYLTSVFRPHYLREYVSNLDDDGLLWLYNQMKEPLEFLFDESYLYYKFKWIKDRDFDDLSYEIYVEYLCNPEFFNFTIIKPEWENILYERYKDKIRHLLFPF